MRLLLSLGLVCGLLGVAAADAKKDPTAGNWVVESVTRDGKADASLKGATRTHEGGKYSMSVPGKDIKLTGTYTVDASKSPITIDMKPDAGQYKGKTLQGIVKDDSGTVTVAFAEPGKDRPTAFESAAGSGVVLVVLKKAK